MSMLCIIGCGAMGTLLAYQYYRATAEPPLCITRTFRGPPVLSVGEKRLEIPAIILTKESLIENMSYPKCRWVVTSVKAKDLIETLRIAARLSRKVWILINGLVGEEEARRMGLEPSFIVSTYGVTRQENVSYLRGSGLHLIGHSHSYDEESCRLAETLRLGGASAYCTELINKYRILKTFVNIAINGLTSIVDAPNGVITSNKYLKDLAWRIAVEGEALARAEAIRLDAQEIYRWIIRVAEETSQNISSTLQDLRNCRKTEVDALFRPLLSRPGNARTIETLYILLKALEEGGLRCRRGRR